MEASTAISEAPFQEATSTSSSGSPSTLCSGTTPQLGARSPKSSVSQGTSAAQGEPDASTPDTIDVTDLVHERIARGVKPTNLGLVPPPPDHLTQQQRYAWLIGMHLADLFHQARTGAVPLPADASSTDPAFSASRGAVLFFEQKRCSSGLLLEGPMTPLRSPIVL